MKKALCDKRGSFALAGPFTLADPQKYLLRKNMDKIDKMKWREKYKELCCELLKMTPLQAKIHLASAFDFDYGYSPIWYVVEEMNVNFVKENGI